MDIEKEMAALLAALFILSQLLANAFTAFIRSLFPSKSILTREEQEILGTLHRLHSSVDDKTGLPRWWIPTDMSDKQNRVLAILASMQHDNQITGMTSANLQRVVETMRVHAQEHDRKLDKILERGDHQQ